MKKFLFLLLASFLVLAACGNKEENKSEDTKETKSSSKDDKKNQMMIKMHLRIRKQIKKITLIAIIKLLAVTVNHKIVMANKLT